MSALSVISENIILAASLGVAFFWSKSEFLSSYLLQFVALVILAFFIFQFIARKSKLSKKIKTTFDFLLLTLVIYLIIFSTGSLSSPVFFLTYFLLFAISLLFEPSAALSLATISSIFFLFGDKKELLTELVQLGSLFLITPLALIFGSQYIKLLQSEEKIEVLEYEGQKLEKEVIEQEKEVARWTYTELSQKLSQIQEGIKVILNDKNVSPEEKVQLKDIFSKIYDVFQSGKEMEKKIQK
jgi:cell division protein FtsB